jgi:CHAT domain-containing protein/tetratricopeptide (TPR) repeat protein
MKHKLLFLFTVLFTVPMFSQTAEEYYNKAYQAFQSGDIQNQIIYAEKAISLYEKEKSKTDNYFNALILAARGYESQQNYEKAILFLEKAQVKYPAGENKILATILINLAGLYESMGNYAKAEPLYLEAIVMQKKILGTEHPGYATSLHNLAGLYESMGNYAKAEPLYLEAMEIRKKVLGTENPDYATSLSYLAGLYESTGNYAKVEPLYLEAMGIRKKVLGIEHPSYATSLNNLALLYKSMGNYAKAEPLYLEAMAIRKKVQGTEHPDYATSLTNLAGLYRSMGKYSKAEPLLLAAMNIDKKMLGMEHPDYATDLNNLAVLYQDMGNYEKSEPLYLEAMAIREKVLGTEHPDYATSLNRLAGLYQSMGNYTKAEPMYLEAMGIYKRVLGIEHPSYATSLNSLAGLYESMGNYEKAYPLLETALSITQKQVKNTFTALSESEKTIFSKKDDLYYDISLSISSFIPNVKSKSIYDRLLFRKGLILNTSINTRSFITSSKNEKLKQKYNDWLSAKQIINNLYSKTLEQIANSGYNLDSLENYANSIEKDLSKMSSTFKDFVMIPDYKWEDVQKNLKQDEAIVDLVKFRLHDKRWTDTSRYGVFVTRFDSKEPVYFEFKDGNRIDTLVIPKFNEKNKNRFVDVSPNVDDEKIIVLNQNVELDYYSELFAPIAQHLKGIKKIYFSLDGEFFKVNFNTIKNPETNKYLIEDYEIVYVSSANEIARGKTEATQNKTAVLLGYPNYDLSLDSLTALSNKLKKSDQSRDTYVNTTSVQRFGLDLLPGTKEEVTVTTELLKKNGWTVDSWLFNQATESNIKNVSAPGILSISTHGYFLPSPKADYKGSFFMGSETKKAVENPLLRSGLFLTGAETFLNSPDASGQKEKFEENGILTAYEASQLNLFGTDLVILSACETGLGEVNNGEGVFGLQRGFLGAGARSVLMSLWKVDDTATKDLMIEFIKNYSTTMNKQKSLRDAQLTIMKKYPLPYFWGAFVMIGI